MLENLLYSSEPTMGFRSMLCGGLNGKEVQKRGDICKSVASLVAQMVKDPPAMRETQVRSLGWGDSLEKGKATHSSILAGEFHGLYSSWGHKESDTTE